MIPVRGAVVGALSMLLARGFMLESVENGSKLSSFGQWVTEGDLVSVLGTGAGLGALVYIGLAALFGSKSNN